MLKFEEAKTLLKNENFSTRYFTQEFFDNFVSEYRSAPSNKQKGEEEYKKTKRSPFYELTGTAYCRFLELFYNSLPMFRIDFFLGAWDASLLERVYERFETEEIARDFAIRRRNRKYSSPGRVFVEVNLIKE